MSSTWFSSLARDYRLPVERVAELYQQAQSDRSRGTYAYFIQLLEDEANQHTTGNVYEDSLHGYLYE